MCVTALCLGNPQLTVEHMEQAAAIYDPREHAANTRSTARTRASRRSRSARSRCAFSASRTTPSPQRAGDRPGASGSNQPYDARLRPSLRRHAPPAPRRRRRDRAPRRRGDRLATEEGFSFWRAGGLVLHGWATATTTSGDDGIGRSRRPRRLARDRQPDLPHLLPRPARRRPAPPRPPRRRPRRDRRGPPLRPHLPRRPLRARAAAPQIPLPPPPRIARFAGRSPSSRVDRDRPSASRCALRTARRGGCETRWAILTYRASANFSTFVASAEPPAGPGVTRRAAAAALATPQQDEQSNAQDRAPRRDDKDQQQNAVQSLFPAVPQARPGPGQRRKLTGGQLHEPERESGR